MASNFKISTGARTACADAVAALHDAGVAAAFVEIRTGPPPADPQAADSGTLLAALAMSDPAYGAAVAGVATASPITPATAVGSGDAGHFRCKDSDSNVVDQGTAGVVSDDPDMTFNDKSIVVGGTVSVTSMTLTQPEGGT